MDTRTRYQQFTQQFFKRYSLSRSEVEIIPMMDLFDPSLITFATGLYALQKQCIQSQTVRRGQVLALSDFQLQLEHALHDTHLILSFRANLHEIGLQTNTVRLFPDLQDISITPFDKEASVGKSILSLLHVINC
jgi:hypothetical protein